MLYEMVVHDVHASFRYSQLEVVDVFIFLHINGFISLCSICSSVACEAVLVKAPYENCFFTFHDGVTRCWYMLNTVQAPEQVVQTGQVGELISQGGRRKFKDNYCGIISWCYMYVVFDALVAQPDS